MIQIEVKIKENWAGNKDNKEMIIKNDICGDVRIVIEGKEYKFNGKSLINAIEKVLL